MLPWQEPASPMTLDRAQRPHILALIRGRELKQLINFLRLLQGSADGLDWRALYWEEPPCERLKAVTSRGRYLWEARQVRGRQNPGSQMDDGFVILGNKAFPPTSCILTGA